MLEPHSDARFAVFGLSAYSGNWSGAPVHSHPELELHVIGKRSLLIDYAGQRSRLPAGRINAFWGIRQHSILDDRQHPIRHHVIRIPLAFLWQCELPPDFIRTLLSKGPQDLGTAHRAADATDWMQHMVELLNSPKPLLRRAAEAHIQAFLFEAAAQRDLGRKSRDDEPVSHSLARRLESVVLALSNPSRQRPSIAAAAELAGLHRVTAGKVFRKMTGLSLREFVMSLRVQHATWLLHNTHHSIGEVAERCGFNSVPRFHAAFLKRIGKTPGAFRQAR
ncbi:MAG: helix-turn-helix transcriptional regulator [Limisphaerales bacterium]